MTIKKAVTNSMVGGAVALAIAGISASDAKAEHHENMEKCYGVAKAGHNDCGVADGKHSCQHEATVDSSGHEWVALPKGVCDKLVGGSLTPYDGTAADHNNCGAAKGAANKCG